MACSVESDVIPNQVPKESRVARKEPGETAGVTRAQLDGNVPREMQKGVGFPELGEFVAPPFPHGSCDVRHCRGRIPRSEIGRVIKRRQRAGNVACPVAFVRLQHTFTLSGTPEKPGNHSDEHLVGHRSGSVRSGNGYQHPSGLASTNLRRRRHGHRPRARSG